MSHDEPNAAVAVHRRAARRVAHRPVEVVHAVEEDTHVGQHPQPVVGVEFDDQRIVVGQLPGSGSSSGRRLI